MKKRSERNTTIVLLLVGTLALVGGIYLFVGKLEFLKNSVVVDGVVSDLDSRSSKNGRTYYPVITYRGAGGREQTFVSSVGSSPASYEIGESVRVRYEAGKPSTAVIAAFWEIWGIVSIAAGLGLIFLAIGISTIVAAMRLNRLREELPRTGRMIELPGRAEKVQSKSKTEFYVRSEWHNPEDGKIYLFDSEKFYFDPTPFLVNRLVQVWIDPLNPKKRYYVDTAFLPVEA
ncbi:DUF3592 domain-containing protein [Persicitalea jodogahamensis]|uniref:DUF3592 domain-containing protein n=1 Tax=Persicitalea jodogahamensis TaxID=402147 RepID=A0A8J3G8X5_9BACT|nr:DUF3592 domain-containing protein [Persicitalea jodogahamensis]GHB68865.1 hypothetical protein GCM10007390_22930 [Persicitalea jodogahamensis]